VTSNEESEPRWLSGSELLSWMRFSGMLLKLHSALDAELQREAGLSFFTYLVLAGLSEAPDHTLRMSDLAVLANGSLSRLSHAVAKLERRGWVRRHPCPEDGRITLATLTDAGLDKIRESAPAHVESVRRLVIDMLNEDQLRQLGEISALLLSCEGERFVMRERRSSG
jgi:DNA-binding MarR family transcriptional regulator